MRMKMVATAIVLMGVLALCHFAQAAITTRTEVMRAFAIRADYALSQAAFDQAIADIDALIDYAAAHRAVMEVLTMHGDLNAATSSAMQARLCAQYRDAQSARSAIRELMDALVMLDERQQLTVGNLL